MTSTDATESPGSASSSDAECEHTSPRVSSCTYSVKTQTFWCPDCDKWVHCPHTSWRWYNSFRLRKICNWCGHQWKVDPLGNAEDEDPKPKAACAHVAFEVTQYEHGYPQPGVERQTRVCADCGHIWVERVECEPAPAEATLDEKDFQDFDDAIAHARGREPVLLIAVDYVHEGVAHSVLIDPTATVIAEDGVLKVSHNGPIHAIVGVRPIYATAPEESREPDPEGW
jgi:hypothetical protein